MNKSQQKNKNSNSNNVIMREYSWNSDKHDKYISFRQSDLQDLKALLCVEDDCAPSIKEGDIIDVVAVHITDKFVIVKTGMKSEGLISIQEFIDIGEDNVQVGDKFEVIVLKIEDESGRMLLSRKSAVSTKHWDELCKAVDNQNALVTGLITSKIRGGFRVDLGYGIPGFLPNSQTGMSSPEEFEALYCGKECQLKPVSIGTNIVVSVKDLVESSVKDKRQQILQGLKEGNIVEGVVKNITNFGIFISINNLVDGLIRIPDLSYRRIKRPSELNINTGDKIKAMVLSNENGIVSFGLKQLEQTPWALVEEKFPVGATVSGKAVNIMTYGVFVEVAPGIEGLVHFSEIPISQPINNLNEIISLGDEIEAVVMYSNAETCKLSLSMIRAGYNKIGWTEIEKKYHIGSTHQAIVKSLLKHCAIIELEPGVTAQVHISDISDKIQNPSSMHSAQLLSLNEKVNVRILKISQPSGQGSEMPRKIVAGIKQFDMGNWEEESAIKEGDIVDATILKLSPFGAIASFGSGHKGYIHVSEIKDGVNEKNSKISDLLSVGQTFKAMITSIEKDQKMVNLSIKKANDMSQD